VVFAGSAADGSCQLLPGGGYDGPSNEKRSVEVLRTSMYIGTKRKNEAVPFEDYVKGVVAGEMPSSFEMEALKAQAVAARTYSVQSSYAPEPAKSRSSLRTGLCRYPLSGTGARMTLKNQIS